MGLLAALDAAAAAAAAVLPVEVVVVVVVVYKDDGPLSFLRLSIMCTKGKSGKTRGRASGFVSSGPELNILGRLRRLRGSLLGI